MSELSDLAPAEKLKRCRALAADALNHASRSTEQREKEAYLLIAEQWAQLAQALDVEIQRAIVDPASTQTRTPDKPI